MAVVNTTITATMDLQGKSTDTKPTTNVPVGSSFYEEDTKTFYIFTTSGTWQTL